MRKQDIRLRNLITEAYLQFLNEKKHTKDVARERTIQAIKNYFEGSQMEKYLDKPFKGKSFDTNGLPLVDFIEDMLRNEFFHSDNSDAFIRLEPMVARIALELDYTPVINTSSIPLRRLKKILTYIKFNYDKESFLKRYGKPLNELVDLNRTTYNDLNEMFGPAIDELARGSVLKNAKTNNDRKKHTYTIEADIDYERAKEIGQYSCSTSQLCYSISKYVWNQYTNRGRNTAYLLLRDDWESVPEEHGEKTPYDDYGLSMIFLFVNEEGDLIFSNTRWNHDTEGWRGDVDQSFTEEEISSLLGKDFKSTFKPVTIEDKWNKTAQNALQRFRNGEPPKKVFDFFEGFVEGFARVGLNGKFNLMRKDGTLVSPNQWFYNVSDFVDGFAIVQLDNKFNIIDTQGRYVFNKPINEWFDEVDYIYKGFAKVRIKENWYLIDSKCNVYDEDTLQPLNININNLSESYKQQLTKLVTERVIQELKRSKLY